MDQVATDDGYRLILHHYAMNVHQGRRSRDVTQVMRVRGALHDEDVKPAGAQLRCEVADDNSYRPFNRHSAGTARSLHPVR